MDPHAVLRRTSPAQRAIDLALIASAERSEDSRLDAIADRTGRRVVEQFAVLLEELGLITVKPQPGSADA